MVLFLGPTPDDISGKRQAHPFHTAIRFKMRIPLTLALLFAIGPAILAAPATGPDYEREQRWADQTLAGLVVGDAVLIEQKNGHKFLGLYTQADASRGAVVVAHGRGWAPDHELYGQLRMLLADSGYTTLSIQMPVLDGTAKLGDYLPVFPDAGERLALAADWLHERGHKSVGIVSHSIGASMANHYLVRTPDHKINAWVFISIINGLDDMFRIQIPVLDIFGSEDWSVTRLGADERLKQIVRIEGSQQVIVADAEHFFEGQEDALISAIVAFLDGAFGGH